MRLAIKTAILAVIVLFTASCAYEFSDDYFKDIQINDPNANISLSGFTNGEETSSSKFVQYSISGVGNDEFEMVVKVDEIEIHRSEQKTGEFYLYVDELSDGPHQLSIEYIFPSNSGSLADALDGEYYLARAEYSFIVDKSLASAFGINQVNIVQGSIVITLNPATDTNFDEAYLLVKDEYGYGLEERLITPQELATLQIRDEQTVIYNPQYAIKVKNAFAESTSSFITLSTEKMVFTIEPLTYNSFKLIYNAHPLYANFDSMGFNYTYRYSGGAFHNVNPQGGETIINYGYYFGETFQVIIKMFKNNSQIGNLIEYLQVGNNLSISNFDDVTYIASLDKYFILDVTTSNELKLYQLNSQSLQVENSQTLTTLSFSGDFNSLEVDTATNNLIINLKESAIIFNPASFSIVNTYNAIDFDANHQSADVYYRGNYVILEDPWSSGQVLIYEIATGTLKFSVTKTTNFFSAVDASYFYANAALYKLDGGNFVFVNTVGNPQNGSDAPPLDRMVFNKNSNSAVYGWYRNTYYLNLSNNTATSITSPDNTYDVSYSDDGKPLVNSSHFSDGTRAHLYDAASNQSRKIDTFGQLNYRYVNGVMFAPNGFYLVTNLYPN